MNTDRMKKAAQWLYTQGFRDEPIRPRPEQPQEKLPSLLRTARSLENAGGTSWQSRESVFIKQAKLLATYEDDYSFTGSVTRYFPTYQSLTDRELRGYFSWRTKLRQGDVRKTSLSFAFLYIYELINQVGTEDSMDGYRKLKEFGEKYGPMDGAILPYLEKWCFDYVIYYGLDPMLLADSPQVVFDRCLTILEHLPDQPPEKVMYAFKQICPKWLERSRFYNAHPTDMDTVIVRVLRRLWQHYDQRCKKGFVEQCFGNRVRFQVRLFENAVFLDKNRDRRLEYAVDERCIYRCANGLWTVEKNCLPHRPNSKLNDIVKAIDALMREAWGYGHPIKCQLETKWILKIIREEIQILLDEKKDAEAKKITIDYSVLDRIRRDAAITREKLTVEEELEEDLPAPPSEESEVPSPAPEPVVESPLTAPEYRLLQCLLYGRDHRWVQNEGFILSVLVDGINEKLYDTFLDSVLDDTPELVEDYIDDLKEMIHP